MIGEIRNQHGERSMAKKLRNTRSALIVTSGRLVEINVDALQLQVGVAMIGSRGVNSVLVRKNLPEDRNVN